MSAALCDLTATELATKLVAGGGAGVGLLGAFVFADLDVIRADADLVEQALVEHGL